MEFGPRGSSYLTDFESCLRRNNLDFEKIDVTGQLKRFPKLSFPADFEFIIEKCGGILWANKVLKALQVSVVHWLTFSIMLYKNVQSQTHGLK